MSSRSVTAARARTMQQDRPTALGSNRMNGAISGEARNGRGNELAGGASGANEPVTSYEASNALLNTYQTRRKMLSKAAQLSNHMLAEAKIIAEIEEENLLITVHQGAATGKPETVAQEGDVKDDAARDDKPDPPSVEADNAAVSLATGTDKDGDDSRTRQRQEQEDAEKDEIELTTHDKGIALQVQSDTEIIKAQVGKKRDKLRVLRGLQQSIIELDERNEKADELRAQRARWLDGGEDKSDAGTKGTEGDAAGDDRDTTDETHGVAPRQSAVDELRANLYVMFSAANEDPTPPSPPKIFTSNALAITLECMDRSLAAVVAASDAVCVATTFNARDEPVTLQLTLDELKKQCEYLQKCCELALSHEAHFEVGERALREGGTFEVNCLREQFLHRKETLTTQEQKERLAEEQRNGLRTRLRNLQRRCDMWEEVFFHRAPATPPVTLERLLSAAQETPFSRHWPSERRFSVFGRSLHGRPSSAASHASGTTRLAGFADVAASEERARSPSAALPAGGSGGEGCAPLSPRRAAVTLPPIAARLFSGEAALLTEDVLELRVAQTWGNPYVSRASQYSHATAVSPTATTAAATAAPAGASTTARTASPSLLASRLHRRHSSMRPGSRNVASTVVSEETFGRISGARSASTVSMLASAEDNVGASSHSSLAELSSSDHSFGCGSEAESDLLPSAAARAVAEARTMGLLQSLLRTIPTAMSDVDTPLDQRPGQATNGKAAAELRAQQELRASTRASIQKLIRHLAAMGRRSSDVN